MKYVDIHYNFVRCVFTLGIVVGCANSYEKSSKPSNEKNYSESTAERELINKWDSAANVLGSVGITTNGTGGLGAGDPNTEGIEKHLSQIIDRWEASFHRVEIEAVRVEQIPLGLWVGETEAQIACSESRRVILELAFDEKLKVAFGVAVFGEGAPPPPPDDPNVGYPPGVMDEDFDNPNIYSNLSCHLESPTEGFGYTILDGHVSENGRFQFRIAVLEPYDAWCLLQTRYPCDRYRFRCLFDYYCLPDIDAEQDEACEKSINNPRYAEHPEDPEFVPCPFDLGKYMLCNLNYTLAPCICERDGCRADMNRTILLDMMIDKDELHGQMISSNFANTQPVEIKLRRQTL